MPFKSGSWGSDAKERSKRRREYFRNYRRQRYSENPEEFIKQSLAWREHNRHKYQAQYKALWTCKIPLGQLCEICNLELATCRHHENYDKPYDVKFLCNSCHRSIHGKGGVKSS